MTLLRTRGPTRGEIPYALAEITEIKISNREIIFIKEKSQASAEISPQYTRFP